MINYEFTSGASPVVTTAIHNGHDIRPEILPYLELTDFQRKREEDPYTAHLADISVNTIKIFTSRFETDINRPREKAVYCEPSDSWGLQVFRKKLPEKIVERSLRNHDRFYQKLHAYIAELLKVHEWLIVYDLHSYNHRRGGVDEYADPKENPEINIGTGNVTSDRWRPVIDQLIGIMRSYNYEGRFLDVRENVKFKGGYFSKWLTENFGEKVCPIAIEMKKFFMDEWTGEADPSQLSHLRQLLIDTLIPVTQEAKEIHQHETSHN